MFTLISSLSHNGHCLFSVFLHSNQYICTFTASRPPTVDLLYICFFFHLSSPRAEVSTCMLIPMCVRNTYGIILFFQCLKLFSSLWTFSAQRWDGTFSKSSKSYFSSSAESSGCRNIVHPYQLPSVSSFCVFIPRFFLNVCYRQEDKQRELVK